MKESEVIMSPRYTQLPAACVAPAEKILRAALHSLGNPGDHRTAEYRQTPEDQEPVFVTVSRQPGAGAVSFSHRLAKRLNERGTDHWLAWDRELVEKVSAESGIAAEIIEAIPDSHHNWLEEMLQNLAVSESPPDQMERRAYKRVALAIRALATAGHAIIVGLGGVFITEGMPSAVHLRLIAPLEYRIKSMAEWDGISLHHAAEKLIEIDRRRSEFYRRYWPGKVISPDAFSMTLNSAEMDVEELVECVLPLIQIRRTTENFSAPSTAFGR
jgi:cytidylate kinase